MAAVATMTVSAAVLGAFELRVNLPPGEHDAFEWWAEIWIPSLVGIATVGVSAVALWVSHRATVLARAVETQREKAADEREREARQLRLQELALEDARTLNRWIVEAYNRSWRRATAENGRSEREQARIDAAVALEQSIVPGADDLLAITKYDIENMGLYLATYNEESDESRERKDRIYSARNRRSKERIRRWALNPEKLAPAIATELAQIDDDPINYLMFGEEPEPEGFR